ncbi:phage/plasmid primase, P4 family [Streptococcus uberis]|nr:phage/plasmid primase, P4 family [Streptococcus uberis]
MNDIYNRLYELGAIWREDHQYIVNAGQKNERIVTPLPEPRDIAKHLKSVCHFVFIGYGHVTDKSPLYLYDLDTGLYTASEDLFNRLCSKFDSRLKPRAWKDTLAFIRTSTNMKHPLESSTLIPVNNGIFDLKNKVLLDFSPKYIITSKIATSYNPEATKPILNGWFDFDKWLESIACNDHEIITLLWQIMNEAINPNRTRKKMVILTGSGNNGKGTFQALLENLIGKSNISNLKPDQFGEKHLLSALNGKVANIGDDITDKYMDSVSDLMSIVTGDTVQVNPKHAQPYEATYRLLCIFSGNGLPRSRNRTNGWYRRLCIVPFNADFNGTIERPEIKDDFIKNKDLLEWILFNILNMPDFEKFIEPKAVMDILEDYKTDNDFYYSFVTTEYIPKGYHEIVHVPLPIAREWLEDHVRNEGINNANLWGFGKKIVEALNKVTNGNYEVKSGHVRLEDYDILDPMGFKKDILKSKPKGIRKMKLGD